MLKFWETEPENSFIARGIGHIYQYDADSRTLEVVHGISHNSLIYIDFDKALAKNPHEYVRLLEKTSQLRALMLSNNQTVDLAETLEEGRLCAILGTAASTARFCFDLKREKFKRFAKYFCRDYGLRSLLIEHLSGYDPQSAFYHAVLTTQQGNVTQARGTSLSIMLSVLAENVIQDLLTKEFGYNLNGGAHALLRISHKLSVLGCILNDAFVPSEKLIDCKKQELELRA